MGRCVWVRDHFRRDGYAESEPPALACGPSVSACHWACARRQAGSTGALITARLAHDLNREVFAVPGRVDYPETSAGTNGLIRDGQAKLITCLEDILDELQVVGRIMGRDLAEPSDGTSSTAANDSPPLSAHERTVLQTIRDGAEDADDICAKTGLESGTVTTALTSLQLKGLVTRLPGNRFALRRSG